MSLKNYPGSDLNKISSTLKKYLDERKLKPLDIVKYRLLNGKENKDPQKIKGDDIIFPSSVNIPVAGTIIDPGDTDKDGNVTNSGLVQIAAVRYFDDKTKQPAFKKFYVRPEKGDGGIFILRGNVAEDLEMYDVLELSNVNASNPYRDVSFEPIFERVDEMKEANKRSAKRNYLFDSLNAIRNWSYDEMRIIGAGYNLSTSLPQDVLRDRLEEIAEKDPKTFFESIESDSLKTKAVIKMAKDAGVISFIAHENKWIYTGSDEPITILDRKEGITETEQFALFLKNNVNGDKILGNLKKLIAAKKGK